MPKIKSLAFCYTDFFFKSFTFWDITQYRLVVVYQCFGTAYWFHLQWSSSPGRMVFLIQSLLNLWTSYRVVSTTQWQKPEILLSTFPLGCLTLEDGNYSLSINVSKKLLICVT